MDLGVKIGEGGCSEVFEWADAIAEDEKRWLVQVIRDHLSKIK